MRDRDENVNACEAVRLRPVEGPRATQEWTLSDGTVALDEFHARFDTNTAVAWVDDGHEICVTGLGALGDSIRGSQVLRWLHEELGKPLFVVQADCDALGFLDKMLERGLIDGYTQDDVDAFFGIDFGDGEPPRRFCDIRRRPGAAA